MKKVLLVILLVSVLVWPLYGQESSIKTEQRPASFPFTRAELVQVDYSGSNLMLQVQASQPVVVEIYRVLSDLIKLKKADFQLLIPRQGLQLDLYGSKGDPRYLVSYLDFAQNTEVSYSVKSASK